MPQFNLTLDRMVFAKVRAGQSGPDTKPITVYVKMDPGVTPLRLESAIEEHTSRNVQRRMRQIFGTEKNYSRTADDRALAEEILKNGQYATTMSDLDNAMSTRTVKIDPRAAVLAMLEDGKSPEEIAEWARTLETNNGGTE